MRGIKSHHVQGCALRRSVDPPSEQGGAPRLRVNLLSHVDAVVNRRHGISVKLAITVRLGTVRILPEVGSHIARRPTGVTQPTHA